MTEEIKEKTPAEMHEEVIDKLQQIQMWLIGIWLLCMVNAIFN